MSVLEHPGDLRGNPGSGERRIRIGGIDPPRDTVTDAKFRTAQIELWSVRDQWAMLRRRSASPTSAAPSVGSTPIVSLMAWAGLAAEVGRTFSSQVKVSLDQMISRQSSLLFLTLMCREHQARRHDVPDLRVQVHTAAQVPLQVEIEID
jgi:hypothetical protein